MNWSMSISIFLTASYSAWISSPVWISSWDIPEGPFSSAFFSSTKEEAAAARRLMGRTTLRLTSRMNTAARTMVTAAMARLMFRRKSARSAITSFMETSIMA